MHGGVPSLSVTSIFTQRALIRPRPAGQYTGSPAATDCCSAFGTGVSEPEVVP